MVGRGCRGGKRRSAGLAEVVGLNDAADRRVGGYSGGMKRRLALATALVHRPRVLFLDEPTTGLDPASRQDIWSEVRDINEQGTTVFLTTQYLEEADALCDRLAIIDLGKLVREGNQGGLKAELKERKKRRKNPTLDAVFLDATGRRKEVSASGVRHGRGEGEGGAGARDLGRRGPAKGRAEHGRPAIVCRAEALPFADRTFDTVCGAQMWHWVDKVLAPVEVARVLRPGGRLLLWWNETQPANLWWWDRQQDRLEDGNPSYSRGYREVDYGAQLGEWFDAEAPVTVPWERTLTPELYARWLRSKSYVQVLHDVDAFVEASLAELGEAFPDGQIVEPFVTRLWRFTAR